jgi:hypothetical protein
MSNGLHIQSPECKRARTFSCTKKRHAYKKAHQSPCGKSSKALSRFSEIARPLLLNNENQEAHLGIIQPKASIHTIKTGQPNIFLNFFREFTQFFGLPELALTAALPIAPSAAFAAYSAQSHLRQRW